jgi:hypothetical protein
MHTLVTAPAAIVAVTRLSWAKVHRNQRTISARQAFAIRCASTTAAIFSNIAILIARHTCLIKSIISFSTLKTAQVLIKWYPSRGVIEGACHTTS